MGFKSPDKFLTDPSKAPPQQPAPDPEQIKAQSAMQMKQMDLQADAQKFQAQTQLDMQRIQMEAQAKQAEQAAALQVQQANDERDAEREQLRAQLDAAVKQQESQAKAQMEAARLEFERWKAELDARVKLRIAMIGTEQSGDDVMAQVNDTFAMTAVNPLDKLAEMQGQTAQSLAMLAEALARPKQIVRDSNGRAQGIA